MSRCTGVLNAREIRSPWLWPVSAPRLLSRAMPIAIVAGLATLYFKVVSITVPPHQDFDAYLEAARAAARHQSVYGTFLQYSGIDAARRPLAFIYPPIFAALTAPLARLPAGMAWWSWLLLMQAALAISGLLILRHMRASRSVVVWVIAVTLSFNPLWWDTITGQVNLLLLLLVTLGVLGVIRGNSRASLLIGVAAALKLTPGLLLIWLLLEGRVRAALWMVAGFAAITVLAAILFPADSWIYVHTVLPALSHGSPNPANQSLAAVLDRLAGLASPGFARYLSDQGAIIAIALTLLCAGWWASHRSAPMEPLARAATFLPLLPMVSPVTWAHHLVILLPLVWLSLAAAAARSWPIRELLMLGAIGLFLSLIPAWDLGALVSAAQARAIHSFDLGALVLANSSFIGTIILFMAGPWLLRPVAPDRLAAP